MTPASHPRYVVARLASKRYLHWITKTCLSSARSAWQTAIGCCFYVLVIVPVAVMIQLHNYYQSLCRECQVMNWHVIAASTACLTVYR